jgi:Escherichia/Staphylococcus phage prohead protease
MIPFQFELKSLNQDGTVEGYASTHDLDEGNDRVMPGAFAKSVAKNPSVPMLWSHDTTQPIGTWHSLTENAKGLYVKGRMILTVARAKEVYDLLQAKAVSGLSIGFRTVKASTDRKTGTRLLEQLDLKEISLCTFPMNAAARIVSVKCDEINSKADFERLLREAGWSRSRAKILASKGFVPAEEAEREVRKSEVSKIAASILARANKTKETISYGTR